MELLKTDYDKVGETKEYKVVKEKVYFYMYRFLILINLQNIFLILLKSYLD